MRFPRLLVLSFVLVAPTLTAQNLLQNPDFDHDLSGWTIDANLITTTWQPIDSAAEIASGSARLVNNNLGGYGGGLSQCIAVTGGEMYEIGARVFLPTSDIIAGSALAGINVNGWYSSTNCDPSTNVGRGVGQAITRLGEWTQVSDFEAAPASARSAIVLFLAETTTGGPAFEASFDHLFFGVGTPSAPGATVTQYLPAVASLHGLNAFFHSDVWITNLSYQVSAPLTMTYHCYAGQTCNSTPHSLTIAPRKTIAFPDVVGSFLASPETGGGLEIVYDPYLSPIAVVSRLYTPSAQPTFGFSLQGQFVRQALTRADFPGIAGGGPAGAGFRSNVGFYNPNDSQANVTITLYDNSGTQLGTPIARSVAAHSAVQVNGIFAAAGASSATLVTDANAVCTSDLPLFSFASILDNVSNDSSFLTGVRDFAPKQ